MKPVVRQYQMESARIDWRSAVPSARDYEDVYFSRDGGLAETRHVFIGGNHLVQRWQELQSGMQFCIGETGFGTGLNFLCCWDVWRDSAPAGARLHFVSCEQFPLDLATLERAHAAFPELAQLSAKLRAVMPHRVRGQHRLQLDDSVTLDLLYEEAGTAWSSYVGGIDAWFLDGFAPSRNPDMWSEPLLQEVAAHARPEATLATWSVAALVRERLQGAGFELQRLPGFGHKRHMLQGVFRGVSRYPRQRVPKTVSIIGSGLAGSALASAVTRRGIACSVISDPAEPAASDTPRAVLFARLSPFDNPHARLQICAYQHALRQPDPVSDLSSPARLQRCGVLQCAEPAMLDKWRLLCETGGLPAAIAELLSTHDIRARWNMDAKHGGLWFPEGGWISPPAYCRTILQASGADLLAAKVQSIQQRNTKLILQGTDGQVLTGADACIVAAGHCSSALLAPHTLPLNPVRGQYSTFPAPQDLQDLQTVICGRGYLLPAHQGRMACGATYQHDDHEPGIRDRDHQQNLRNAAALSPRFAAALAALQHDPAPCDGHVAWRATLPGRLPAAGPLGNGLHVLAGLGSRGLVFSALCAELVAARLCDEPWPVERELAQAMDPLRFQE